MKNRKGIILAGGLGTRLYPITSCISKQLLPVYDKPMIYYPISTLMIAGIRDILIISSPECIDQYKFLLSSGKQWGINFQYEVQPSPDGLAQAFILGEKFIDSSSVALILGDNIFYGHDLKTKLNDANLDHGYATIFVYHVKDPERYGVADFDCNNKVTSIVEKPKNPESNFAVTGLYFYDNDVIDYSKSLNKSKRGELEITDLNNIYLKKNKLKVQVLDRGFAWLDTGTHESLLEASQFISTIEFRQGLKISCPEEIAYKNNWISLMDLEKIAFSLPNNPYSDYLKKILTDR